MILLDGSTVCLLAVLEHPPLRFHIPCETLTRRGWLLPHFRFHGVLLLFELSPLVLLTLFELAGGLIRNRAGLDRRAG
ncbi:MAG TPA: hypothetical protein VG206_25930 [Terriglobia bacterium]|nr:hypothetical protein [Terriglobia bacterium]